MPIYEYRCRKCQKKSEIITFRVSEEVPAECSHCGSPEVERIPSRVRVRLSEETRMDAWPIHPVFQALMKMIRRAWRNG